MKLAEILEELAPDADPSLLERAWALDREHDELKAQLARLEARLGDAVATRFDAHSRNHADILEICVALKTALAGAWLLCHDTLARANIPADTAAVCDRVKNILDEAIAACDDGIKSGSSAQN